MNAKQTKFAAKYFNQEGASLWCSKCCKTHRHAHGCGHYMDLRDKPQNTVSVDDIVLEGL
jgi:hypothetical protein